mmetsp:Transcript_11833/g.32360  ORF Transcript_11833/g.32360 Transcript_11833/m.32360 type:complete len:497 (-) Transcript_11833:88-1578(-)|eukprot:CAMPEP_0171181206 /NCGR_PEP_ID=MMETSP0790-20130122/14143_1 /TAXON_ID=2925 /ORGANISM="Alexandrium catenella, Strain OF101" /LENGTH=496 /DNA_ID=CAMNT_0011646143 /DNA_START=58 /DNA_END=1548 /DNA_ORIENTATION=-
MADKATKLNAEVDELLSKDTPDLSGAMDKANEALAIYKDLKDLDGQTEVYRKMISAKIMDRKNPEARQVATDAVEAFAKAGDVKGQAAAKLLLSEACMSTGKTSEALAAAKEAYKLSKDSGDKDGMANALEMVVTAELTNVDGEAVSAATERVEIYKETGDQSKQGYALLLLAQTHVTRIGLKLAICAIASVDDSMGALQSAKDAHAVLAETGDRDGSQGAMDMMARVLMYNGVPSHIIERLTDPEDVFQDVISGKYSTTKNGLPSKVLPTNLKLEEVVPSAKQLERGKFSWNNPLAGYCYTLMWQAAKDRQIPNKFMRGQYDIMTLNTGAKTMSVSNAFTAMSNDAAERNSSMIIYMTSHNSSQQYGSQVITQTAVLASMITARLGKITFVQMGESHNDWTDTRARAVNVYPVTLALMRSCRIEAPTVNIGFVSGDACSWVADPAPLIESLFDTLESDECELMYKRGESFAPLIIHRAMDDGVAYVKPKRAVTGM